VNYGAKLFKTIFGTSRAVQIRSAVLLLLALASLWVLKAEGAMEQHFIYFPESELVLTPDRYALPFEEVFFDTEDGMRLHGWYVPGEAGQPVVLFFHGNAGNISHRVENLWYLNRLGLGVLIFDYRGYGKSAGRPGEKGLALDARAAQQWLAGRGWTPREMVYFGRSLGAAVALQLASEIPPGALILESPFSSIAALGRHHYPLLSRLLGWMIEDRYDNLTRVVRLDAPLLIFHGDRDSIVPIRMGRELFDAAPEPKQFHTIPGAGHNDTYELGGQLYWQQWQDFLGELCL